jgi:hypothetical protein
MMKLEDTSAIAIFLQQGGEVRKMADVIPVTRQEVLAYLASCGVQLRYIPEDDRPYVSSDKRRYSITGLLRLANSHRRALGLPPFAISRR